LIKACKNHKRGRRISTAVLFAFLLCPFSANAKCGVDFEHNLRVAQAYEVGEVVPKNPEKSAKAYLRAVSSADIPMVSPLIAEPMYKVGIAYRDGAGLPQSDEEAYFWLGLAAAKDEKYFHDLDQAAQKLDDKKIKALDARRKAFIDGTQKERCIITGGEMEDYRTAMPRLQPLAEKGDWRSQLSLAEYLNMLESYQDAYYWSSRSALGCGDEKTCPPWIKRQKEEAESHLTPEEISEQDARVAKKR
jgi:TPR repeat protein